MDTKTTLLLKPTEVAEQLRISRAKTYELIASKDIPSVLVGSSRASRWTRCARGS